MPVNPLAAPKKLNAVGKVPTGALVNIDLPVLEALFLRCSGPTKKRGPISFQRYISRLSVAGGRMVFLTFLRRNPHPQLNEARTREFHRRCLLGKETSCASRMEWKWRKLSCVEAWLNLRLLPQENNKEKKQKLEWANITMLHLRVTRYLPAQWCACLRVNHRYHYFISISSCLESEARTNDLTDIS